MAPPMSGPEAAGDHTLDPMAVLAAVPKDAQLLLRDYIAGLEAQAGSARAAAERQARKFQADSYRLLLQASGARSERDAAIAERDTAQRTVAELSARCQALESSASRRRTTGR